MTEETRRPGEKPFRVGFEGRARFLRGRGGGFGGEVVERRCNATATGQTWGSPSFVTMFEGLLGRLVRPLKRRRKKKEEQAEE